MAAIRHVEETVPGAVPEGLVLRYGSFYGHGASDIMLDVVRKRQMPVIGGGTGIWSFCEITDAAAATAAAVDRGAPGIYNIVDDDPAPVAEWLPYLAECARRQGAACAPRPGWAAARRPARRLADDPGPRLGQREGQAGTRLGSRATRAGGTASGTGRKRRSRPVPPEAVSPDDYAEFRPLMFSIAYRMTGSISDAEDIVQEAFLRLTRALRDGTSIDSPKAYLATVTTRLAINHLRSARVRRESYVGAWLPEPLLADAGARSGRAAPRWPTRCRWRSWCCWRA